MSALAQAPIQAKLDLLSEAEEPLVLENIRWSTYQALLRDLGDRPIHLTYDQGRLEIMTLSPRHEILKKFIDRFIEHLSLELGISIKSLGSTTIARKELKRGLEPDECYYIGREALVRRKMEFNFRKDPPPDLAVEVDVSRSSISRQRVYAALGIPEVWRFDGKLHVLHLQANGQYAERDRSLSFPFLPMAQVESFIYQISELDEITLIRNFRDWVRKKVLPKYKARKR
jgi:Uma2 family endonuclease